MLWNFEFRTHDLNFYSRQGQRLDLSKWDWFTDDLYEYLRVWVYDTLKEIKFSKRVVWINSIRILSKFEHCVWVIKIVQSSLMRSLVRGEWGYRVAIRIVIYQSKSIS